MLRPLRTISGIRGLKVIVTSLLSAISLLFDTMLILMFFLLVFAIGGTQLFKGVLKQRCVNLQTGERHPDDMFCNDDCPTGYFCGKTRDNPNHGVTNFDNIYYSMMVIFQSITLEGWSVIMIWVRQCTNWIAYAFFLPLVFMGAFFLINLTIAVIKFKYTEANKKEDERAVELKVVTPKM